MPNPGLNTSNLVDRPQENLFKERRSNSEAGEAKMSTLFHMNVERTKKQPPNLPPEAQALAALKARLPREAVALAIADWPVIVICHKGRVYGLHMKLQGRPLTLAQTEAVIAMREAGMRVETATGPDQAVARAHEMGVALKEDERLLWRDHYRKETRRRP
jgi:hypothetical protein